MMESFTRTRQRPPTHEEWEGLVRAQVREEVYYREALALVVSIKAFWARIAVRVMGSWIAATGLLMIGWSLRTGN